MEGQEQPCFLKSKSTRSLGGLFNSKKHVVLATHSFPGITGWAALGFPLLPARHTRKAPQPCHRAWHVGFFTWGAPTRSVSDPCVMSEASFENTSGFSKPSMICLPPKPLPQHSEDALWEHCVLSTQCVEQRPCYRLTVCAKLVLPEERTQLSPEVSGSC